MTLSEMFDRDPAEYDRRVRRRIGRRHRHVWFRSVAYDSLASWRPVEGLMFCDVPGCNAVKAA